MVIATAFDELQLADGTFRDSAKEVGDWLQAMSPDALTSLNHQASDIFYRRGVTFTVYSDANNIERMIPFDIIPRIIDFHEWQTIEKGCQQRILALNKFIHDIYHEQAIIKDGLVPADFVFKNSGYEPWMLNVNLDKPIYAHISGIDLIRDQHGQYCVLEDNLRTPSGVSYMLESRNVSQTLLSKLYQSQAVLPVTDYPQRLKACLSSTTNKYDPQIVVLTPGRFNSAYYEHAYLAREMKVPLVHGYDLIVENNNVYIQGVRGKVQVDVIYRRIDDPFLDPLAFLPDSILGVSGLMSAYRAGNVVITNAPGTGIADDKSLYPFVPKMIEYYLGEKPILPNVPTYQCCNPDELAYVLDNMKDLVIKETQGSGGYGMLIGPTSTQEQIDDYRKRLVANPAGFIAQPTISLSTNPTAVANGIAPRHIDLRPFVLTHGNGKVDIVPGGLTRVAMTEGSLVVNSSQGGGVKDTWVVDTQHTSNLAANTATAINTKGRKRQDATLLATENINNNRLILLLSTASTLVWLGRYSERLRHYERILSNLSNDKLSQPEIDKISQCIGLSTCQDADSLFDFLTNQKIPETIGFIEQNVQDVKGVLSKETAELYNLIKRLANTGAYRAASLQLYACNAAMQQENPIVVTFWQLGKQFEVLDRAVLLHQDCGDAAQQLKEIISKLPENTRWGELERLVNQLLKSNNSRDYPHLAQAFLTILQQGV